MNLKEAIAKNKLKEFIKERQQVSGDQEKFDSTLDSMVGKSRATLATSDQDNSEN